MLGAGAGEDRLGGVEDRGEDEGCGSMRDMVSCILCGCGQSSGAVCRAVGQRWLACLFRDTCSRGAFILSSREKMGWFHEALVWRLLPK